MSWKSHSNWINVYIFSTEFISKALYEHIDVITVQLPFNRNCVWSIHIDGAWNIDSDSSMFTSSSQISFQWQWNRYPVSIEQQQKNSSPTELNKMHSSLLILWTERTRNRKNKVSLTSNHVTYKPSKQYHEHRLVKRALRWNALWKRLSWLSRT